MTEPGPDEPRELHGLLAAYALDAVDEEERASVEALLARDPAAAEEVARLRETAALLGAATATPPPAHLRDAVLEVTARTPQVPAEGGPAQRPAHPARPSSARGLSSGPSPDAGHRRPGGGTRGTAGTGGAAGTRGTAGTAPRSGAAPRRGSRGRRALATAVAAVVLALAVPGTVAWQQHERAVQAEVRADQLAALLAAPDATLLRSPVEGGGEAVAVLTADAALLVADGLPDPGRGLVYQLWLLRDGDAVPAGLLELRAGSAQEEASGYAAGDGLALSVEPDGGSPQPTTEPVLVLLPG